MIYIIVCTGDGERPGVRELIHIGDRKVAWREAPDPVMQERTDTRERMVTSASPKWWTSRAA
jgi:hypothetical protein